MQATEEVMMVVQSEQEPAAVDPATLAPLYDEAQFAQELTELVAEQAPRLFAVVQEYGERVDGRVDGRVAAWGMAFEDHAKVFSVDNLGYLSLRAPERALRAFTRSPHITARLIWVDPAALPQQAGDSGIGPVEELPQLCAESENE